jgi:DNA-binding transcriptional MerR regulator
MRAKALVAWEGIPDPPNSYRSPVACRLAGITYRQLDSWLRLGAIPAPSIKECSGTGTIRLFSRDDVIRLAAIRDLIAAGVSMAKATQIASGINARTTVLTTSNGGVDITITVPHVDFEVAA